MNMIEKVARALCEIDGEMSYYDGLILAKAAIEAMREPTEAMIDDGQDARLDGGGYYDVWRAMIDAAMRGD